MYIAKCFFAPSNLASSPRTNTKHKGSTLYKNRSLIKVTTLNIQFPVNLQKKFTCVCFFFSSLSMVGLTAHITRTQLAIGVGPGHCQYALPCDFIPQATITETQSLQFISGLIPQMSCVHDA